MGEKGVRGWSGIEMEAGAKLVESPGHDESENDDDGRKKKKRMNKTDGGQDPEKRPFSGLVTFESGKEETERETPN